MRDLCSAVRRCKSSVEKECLGRRRHEEEPVDRLILLACLYNLVCGCEVYGPIPKQQGTDGTEHCDL